MDALSRYGLLLFALLATHLLDHAVNQPARDVPALGGVVGALGLAVVAVAVILALNGSRFAPEAAIGAGLATIAGFMVVHLLGDWTPLSDPYWDFDANALSWALLIAPILAAGGLVAAGVRRLPGRPLPAGMPGD